MLRYPPASVIAVMYGSAAHEDKMLFIYNSAVADLCNHNANAGPGVCFLHFDSWLMNSKKKSCRRAGGPGAVEPRLC